MFTIFNVMAVANNGNLTSIAVAAAVISAIFAGVIWYEAKKTLLHQVILNLLKDYRSFEMHYAIRKLRNFYENNKEKFVEEYIGRLDELDTMLKNDDSKESEEKSLHYLRRLVSNFYGQLGAYYNNEIIPKKLITDNWSKSDLEIISTILIPIEEAIRKKYAGKEKPLEENHPLLILSKLYEQSPKTVHSSCSNNLSE